MNFKSIITGISCLAIIGLSHGFSYAQSRNLENQVNNLRVNDNLFTSRNRQKRQGQAVSQQRFNEQGAPTQTLQNQQDLNPVEHYNLNLTPQQRHCMALEKRLAESWISRNSKQKNLPQLNENLRKWEQKYRRAENEAERKDCYDNLLFFGKEFKKTRRCRRIQRRLEEAKAKVKNLRIQKQRMTSNDTGEEDYLISRLADYGCGKHYEQEDKRRNPSFFSFGFDDDGPEERKDGQSAKIMPFATYRTMCVRTCDGFYYPVSFSTLPSRFPLDEATCQSKCAAPAQLYVYRNPGEQIEQMMSLRGEPYSSQPYAFLYRKKYVEGCSCKQSEFLPKKLGLEKKRNQSSTTFVENENNLKKTPQKHENKRKRTTEE